MVEAQGTPSQPQDPSDSMAAVIWLLNHDVSAFDATAQWMDTVPDAPERARARGVLRLMGVMELDRADLLPGAISDLAAAASLDDPRVTVWLATARFLADPAQLDAVRQAAGTYSIFTRFGIILGIGGLHGASDALHQEAKRFADLVISETADLQFSESTAEAIWLRRSGADTPIAPFNVSGTVALQGDLAALVGDTELAQRHYYTAIHMNFAHRWLFRDEVERRMNEIEEVYLALQAGTESFLGARFVGQRGVTTPITDVRLGGRVGNGSCTLCHSHRTVYDVAGGEAPAVGWIRGRYLAPDVPNPQPVVFALTEASEDARPDGFALGAPIPPTAARDFDHRHENYDGSFVVQAKAGDYFVALDASGGEHGPLKDKICKGHLGGTFGIPQFVPVEVGMVTVLEDGIAIECQ
jgi:hypothetical protein